jgi:hypothetical protein
MKKKNLLEEVELYVDPRPLTEIDSQQMEFIISLCSGSFVKIYDLK